MFEWNAVRQAAGHLLHKHATAAGRKHRALSHVGQDGLPPMPKDRGADQGDVDGPALGMVAAETRLRSAAQQAVSMTPVEEQRVQAEHVNKMEKVQHFQFGGPHRS